MVLFETLSEVVATQKLHIKKAPAGVRRELFTRINPDSNLAVVISGIRRAGKSTLLRQILGEKKDFHYLNFEDIRIFGFELGDFSRLDKVFENENASNYYFFDEIQNVANWERYVRMLVDNKKKVFITGSNASMLSMELGTKLTGRHLRYELLPFSYGEYLTFVKKKSGEVSFNDYLESGGFPEYILSKDIQILQELFTDIITRDIIVRNSLRGPKMVQDIALFLITNIGKEFSYTGLAKLHETMSKNTLIALIKFLEDCFLLFSVPRFEYSLRKQLVNPKKMYAIDTGFIRANSVSFSRDTGRQLENLVYLELRRRKYEIFYYRKNKECDFIVRNARGELSAYQVCAELHEMNKDREIAGLAEALTNLNISTGTILTLSQDDVFEIGKVNIEVLPVWKWLI